MDESKLILPFQHSGWCLGILMGSICFPFTLFPHRMPKNSPGTTFLAAVLLRIVFYLHSMAQLAFFHRFLKDLLSFLRKKTCFLRRHYSPTKFLHPLQHTLKYSSLLESSKQPSILLGLLVSALTIDRILWKSLWNSFKPLSLVSAVLKKES